VTRCRVAVLAVVLVLTTACGVSTEDTPQIVDDSPSQSPEPTPSLDTESPTTSVSVTTATREPS
jgi:hypothetical protein